MTPSASVPFLLEEALAAELHNYIPTTARVRKSLRKWGKCHQAATGQLLVYLCSQLVEAFTCNLSLQFKNHNACQKHCNVMFLVRVVQPL